MESHSPIQKPTIESQPSESDMYEKRKEHWSTKESTLSSVLGGCEATQLPDIKASNELLNGLILTQQLKPFRAIDCGAGIGRITDHVLQHYFTEIDLMEQSEQFITTCHLKYSLNDKIRSIYQSSLQTFEFKKEYDLIWIQWCLENIEDSDLNNFLSKCYKALNDKGMMIVKENYYKGSNEIANDADNKNKECQMMYSEEDLSKQRSDGIYLTLFKSNGFKIHKHFLNPNWPSEFMPLVIYVLSKSYVIDQ